MFRRKIEKIGFGIYVKTKQSFLMGKRILVEPLPTLARWRWSNLSGQKDLLTMCAGKPNHLILFLTKCYHICPRNPFFCLQIKNMSHPEFLQKKTSERSNISRNALSQRFSTSERSKMQESGVERSTSRMLWRQTQSSLKDEIFHIFGFLTGGERYWPQSRCCHHAHSE